MYAGLRLEHKTGEGHSDGVFSKRVLGLLGFCFDRGFPGKNTLCTTYQKNKKKRHFKRVVCRVCTTWMVCWIKESFQWESVGEVMFLFVTVLLIVHRRCTA